LWWEGETFSAPGCPALRLLDASGTLNPAAKKMVLYLVNRSPDQPQEVRVRLDEGRFNGKVQVYTVNGPDLKAENSFEKPDQVISRESSFSVDGGAFRCTLEAHSFTALICAVG